MLPKFLKPYHIKFTNLIRIGPKRDGGYIIDKRIIKKTSKIITCGLHDDWSFEKEFQQENKNCTVLAYDHTVNNSFWMLRLKKDIISFLKLKKLTPKKIFNIFKYIDYCIFFSKKNKHYKKKVVSKKKKKLKKKSKIKKKK